MAIKHQIALHVTLHEKYNCQLFVYFALILMNIAYGGYAIYLKQIGGIVGAILFLIAMLLRMTHIITISSQEEMQIQTHYLDKKRFAWDLFIYCCLFAPCYFVIMDKIAICSIILYFLFLITEAFEDNFVQKNYL